MINSEISDNLSSEILFGKLKNGGIVNVEFDGENLKFEFINLNSKNNNSQISNLKNSNEKFENFKMKK